MKKIFFLFFLAIMFFFSARAQESQTDPVDNATEVVASEAVANEATVEAPVVKENEKNPKHKFAGQKVKSQKSESVQSTVIKMIDVEADDFISARIPEYKAPLFSSVQAEPSSEEAVQNGTGADKDDSPSLLFRFVMWIYSHAVAIFITVGVALLALVLRLKDRKKRRKVFRVKNR